MYVSQVKLHEFPEFGYGAMANHVGTRQRRHSVVPESRSDVFFAATLYVFSLC